MKAFYFFDAVNVCIVAMVYNEVEQSERLVQSHFVAWRFAATDAIYNIGLQSEQLRENGNDDRSLPEPGESENNTFCFMNHGNCLKLKSNFKH